MTAAIKSPDVPLPAGAVKVFEWEHPDITGLPQPVRYFDGTLRVVTIEQPTTQDVEVQVQGTQWADGAVEREIVVHQMHRDGAITIAQACHLAFACTHSLLVCAGWVIGWISATIARSVYPRPSLDNRRTTANHSRRPGSLPMVHIIFISTATLVPTAA